MASWRDRFRKGRLGTPPPKETAPTEVAVLELTIDFPGPDHPGDRIIPEIIRDLEEFMPELESEVARLVTRQLGDQFVVGRMELQEGSILLLAPIRSVADAIVYYVGARQALEWLIRDVRRAVNRWLRRRAHGPMRVTSSNVIFRPVLEVAEMAALQDRRPRHDALLMYLIASHALLLVAILVAGAFLLAHVL
jgi:hypothetical protein